MYYLSMTCLLTNTVCSSHAIELLSLISSNHFFQAVLKSKNGTETFQNLSLVKLSPKNEKSLKWLAGALKM